MLRRTTKKTKKKASISSPYDVLGSYTGKPYQKGERPVQDADDL